MIVQVKCLDLPASPVGFSQEFEGRFDAWVMGKAANLDSRTEVGKAAALHQVFHDGLERDAMKRIVGLLFTHRRRPPQTEVDASTSESLLCFDAATELEAR